MKLWIPFRKYAATLPLNTLSGRYYSCGKDDGSCYLGEMLSFHRKKDAVEYIENVNKNQKYPHEYRIVCFESKD